MVAMFMRRILRYFVNFVLPDCVLTFQDLNINLREVDLRIAGTSVKTELLVVQFRRPAL